MLQLQRASAGSGKTYTLAKKFILYLISARDNEQAPPHLRNYREIADGLGRILAITFTNKATNEMKQRIVEKLADLSRAADKSVPPEALEKIAYLKDFSSELNASPQEIGVACKNALSILLNNYSDFRVSTIDSFFQSILRTFAYESNLNDTYQVEIDSKYLATAAVDATLDEINQTGPKKNATSIWLKILMENAASSGGAWNVFQKSEKRQSIYSRLKSSIFELESEEFKGIRIKLDEYFEKEKDKNPLAGVYLSLKKRIESPLKSALSEAKEKCVRLSSLLKMDGIDPKEDCQRWFDSHLRKLPALNYADSSSPNIFKPLTVSPSKPLLKKGISSPHTEEINSTAAAMYDAYSSWLRLRDSQDWKLWTIYSRLIPYLGLLGEVRIKMHEYLESNNMIQLGETNTMLRRIIGDDDTPFIYERLGTALNHYLIDEFQDTSGMQWEIMSPLLHESDSRGQDNLIIGDAKQSIYRFRDADPSLITHEVPTAFPRHHAAGMNKEENTNWRSDRRIVEFNNFFFKNLVDQISEKSYGFVDFRNLYGNVIQYPSHRDQEGYVEIRIQEGPTSSAYDDEEEVSAFEEIGPLITSLLDRGYHCRDIVILVDTHAVGKNVISELVAYNSTISPGGRKIDFISEESLLVSSAESVGIIISVLRKMSGGVKPGRDSGEGQMVIHDWSEIRSNFSFYSLRHPEMSVAQQIEGFLKEESQEDAVNKMLSTMQTVALPALIEAITENFVPGNLRRSQAVFIAALQDMVLDYCERSAADIASFLSWWDSKGKSKSISSPEGTDAVQVMTIHASKGLEFKCVILPYATASLTPPPAKSEWRWVRPAGSFAEAGLPPFIPIETTKALEDTVHAAVYQEYFDLYIMDQLNAIYVAFTRAVKELYIFTRMPKRSGTTLGSYLMEICGGHDDLFSRDVTQEEAECMLPAGISKWDSSKTILSFGEKPAVKSLPEEDDTSSDQDATEELIIEEYGVDSSPAILQYVESETDIDPMPQEDADVSQEMPEAADTDPRSEGNLMHAVMSMVNKSEDLDRALSSLKMRGLINAARMKEWRILLGEAIENKEVKGWFESDWKIMNERSILFPGSSDKRPDRIMISPDRRKAVIIDYKFGSDSHDKTYRRQVGEYISALREATGIREISGMIWYVKLGKISRL